VRCYNRDVSIIPIVAAFCRDSATLTAICSPPVRPFRQSGQVAQSVERSPEKAGVGGSIPSLATINSIIQFSSKTGCWVMVKDPLIECRLPFRSRYCL
jgi:hypothetical protein